MRRRAGLLLPLLGAAVLAAGCGDDDGGATAWADDVCVNISE